MTQEKVDILLVDDREDGLLALDMALRSPDYNLVKARSGFEALSFLPYHDFALILLDVQMPDMDGFETAKQIKDLDSKYKSIPIIFITAINKAMNYIYQGYGSGAVDYLFKPVDTDVIRSKVAVFVDLFRKNLQVKKQGELLLDNERRERERYLAQLEFENLRRYRNLADAIPHIVFKAKPDMTMDHFNQTWYEYTGLSLEQSNGSGWQMVFDPSDLQVLLDVWKEAPQKRRDVEVECRILRRADPMFRWHLVRIVNERNSLGQISGWIGTCTDIHDRKRSEDELRRKADDLARANKELNRSNKELQQFAYIASHDLQEPLRTVSNYIDLLSMRYKGRLDEDAGKFIAHIYDAAIHAQKLIADLLDFAQIGTKENQLEKVDFETVFSKVVFNLKIALEESGAQITHDPLPELSANGTQMVELLQNIISNSIKFRSQQPLKIHLSAYHDNGSWTFSVRDNGIGIPPQHKDRVFAIFQRLHPKSQYPGTGIGLSICKKIVERHGGRIWIESEPGHGATFFFSLPEGLSRLVPEMRSPAKTITSGVDA